MKLHELRPHPRATKKPKRVGCGPGSGHGKTATKGHKGQGARSGGTKGPGFEGGQQPLIRKVPKRGFTNIFRLSYATVNLRELNRFEAAQPVTPDRLKEAGLVRKSAKRLKILADGELTKPLTVQAHQFSQEAARKIVAAGGKSEVIEGV